MKYFLAICFVLITFKNAEASSCLRPPLYQQYKNADIIFTGIPQNFSGVDESGCGDKIVSFKALKIYKGDAGSEVSVNSGDSCYNSDINFQTGEPYIVFAEMQNKQYNRITGEAEKGYKAHLCSGTQIVDHPRYDDPRPFLEKLSLPAVIYDQTDVDVNDVDVLRAKAGHFLYWGDYATAEKKLRHILALEDNQWAFSELLRSLYEQNEPKKIWDIYLNDKEVFDAVNKDPMLAEDYIAYVDFAAFVLNKEYEQRKPTIRDLMISGLSRTVTTVKHRGIFDSKFWSANFSYSKIEGEEPIVKTRFIDGDFTNTDFKDSDIQQSEFIGSKLEGANFGNAKFSDDISLRASTYDCTTKWPAGFDPIEAGAKNIEDTCE